LIYCYYSVAKRSSTTTTVEESLVQQNNPSTLVDERNGAIDPTSPRLRGLRGVVSLYGETKSAAPEEAATTL
jgi:hypothetical protein